MADTTSLQLSKLLNKTLNYEKTISCKLLQLFTVSSEIHDIDVYLTATTNNTDYEYITVNCVNGNFFVKDSSLSTIMPYSELGYSYEDKTYYLNFNSNKSSVTMSISIKINKGIVNINDILIALESDETYDKSIYFNPDKITKTVTNKDLFVNSLITSANSGDKLLLSNGNTIDVSRFPTLNSTPTTWTWTAGTTSGPTASITGTDLTPIDVAAIPSASSSASGIVTTDSQTFAGVKTFNDSVYLSNLNIDDVNIQYTSDYDYGLLNLGIETTSGSSSVFGSKYSSASNYDIYKFSATAGSTNVNRFSIQSVKFYKTDNSDFFIGTEEYPGIKISGTITRYSNSVNDIDFYFYIAEKIDNQTSDCITDSSGNYFKPIMSKIIHSDNSGAEINIEFDEIYQQNFKEFYFIYPACQAYTFDLNFHFYQYGLSPSINKYLKISEPIKTPYSIKAYSLSASNNINCDGSITSIDSIEAKSFIKKDGTSEQILFADGSAMLKSSLKNYINNEIVTNNIIYNNKDCFFTKSKPTKTENGFTCGTNFFKVAGSVPFYGSPSFTLTFLSSSLSTTINCNIVCNISTTDMPNGITSGAKVTIPGTGVELTQGASIAYTSIKINGKTGTLSLNNVDLYPSFAVSGYRYDVKYIIEYLDPTGKLDLTDVSVHSNNPDIHTVAIGRVGSIYSGQTAIGSSPEPSHLITLGSDGTRCAYITASTSSWVCTSDRRDKADFKKITNSLEFIKKLQPITFVDNHRDKYLNKETNVFNEELYNNQTLKGQRRISGFIAQDVYQSMIEVYDDDNYASIVDYSKYDEPNTPEDRYSMRYTQLIPFLTGAIQEQQKQIESLNQTILQLQEEINSLKNSASEVVENQEIITEE